MLMENYKKIKLYNKLPQPFCQEGHNGMVDWSVKLIDQADDLTSLWRKESFWQHELQTFVPNGLNERGSVHVIT